MIDQLTARLAVAPSQSSEREDLLRQLAEDYVMQRKLLRRPGSARAVHLYRQLVDEYPQYPHMDELVYLLGLEYELIGNDEDARRAWFDVIRRFRSSRWAVWSYFAFGESFAGMGNADARTLDLAIEAYQDVVDHGAGTGLQPWALLRLGQVLDRKGEREKARVIFRQLRDIFPGSEAATAIQR